MKNSFHFFEKEIVIVLGSRCDGNRKGFKMSRWLKPATKIVLQRKWKWSHFLHKWPSPKTKINCMIPTIVICTLYFQLDLRNYICSLSWVSQCHWRILFRENVWKLKALKSGLRFLLDAPNNFSLEFLCNITALLNVHSKLLCPVHRLYQRTMQKESFKWNMSIAM